MSSFRLLGVALVLVLGCTRDVIVYGYVYNPNLMMRMLLANDRIYKDMLKLKNGEKKWLTYLPTFIERVKTLRDYADQIYSRVPPSVDAAQYEQDFQALVPQINALPYATVAPGKPWRPLYYSKVQWWDDTIVVNDLWRLIRNNKLRHLERSASCPFHLFKLYYRINAEKVCRSTIACERDNPTPYAGYDYRYTTPGSPPDEPVSAACKPDDSCDANIALPMMTSMLFTNINKFAETYMCSFITADDGQGYKYFMKYNYEDVSKDSDHVLAFAYSQPDLWKATWSKFFTGVFFGPSLHLTIDAAVTVMQDNTEIFDQARLACNVFPLACGYADIYTIYQNYENMCAATQSRARDLRHSGQIDHGKMVELQSVNLEQIKVFQSIHKLDENLEASVAGISNYFQGLAHYDKGIAEADKNFIIGKLDGYNTSVTTVQSKLEKDLKEAMDYMMVILALDVADRVTLLAEKIATNSNPIKQILQGPDLSDITSLAGDVANALANVAHGAALLANLNTLISDINTVNSGFAENARQLSTLTTLTEQIQEGNFTNLSEDTDRFLAEYAAYTPQVDKSSIVRNNALWSAFKDSTCTFLTADRKLTGSVPKGIANAQLLCENLAATLAEFFAIRESIFDFQFQLVDALAQIIRGNLAEKLAANIQGHGDAVSGALLFTTFFITHTDIQTAASSYCNIIEYQQLGQPYTAGCATADGRFREANLDRLIAYSPATDTTHGSPRHITIPTKPSYPGDTTYIDLNALADGQNVLFKIPKNRTWLLEHRWNFPGQPSPNVAFVKSFELYLPHKAYDSIPTRSEMTITIKSIAGSYTSTVDNAVEYLLPVRSGIYYTTYEENYPSCDDEISNPYSLCNNLPKLCRESSRHPGQLALLPTVLSTWTVNAKWSKGSQKLTWSAPHRNSTSFLLHGKLILATPTPFRKRSFLGKRSANGVTNGCCDGNQYKVNDQCQPCPGGLTARLRGVYCEEEE